MNRDRLMQELDMVGSSVLAVPVTRIWCEELKALILSLESELETSKQKIRELNVKLLRTKAHPAPVEWKPGDEGCYWIISKTCRPVPCWILKDNVFLWDGSFLRSEPSNKAERYKNNFGIIRAILPEVGDGGES